MISLAQGARIQSLPNLVIASGDGQYADTDLILCASADVPDFPVAQYQAQFIRYGEVVYQFETPEALGEALVAIDPESTHDAAQLWREEEARRFAREKGTLAPADQTPAPDAIEPQATPEGEEEDVKFFKEQEEKEIASSTPEIPPIEPDIPVIDAGETLGVSTSTDTTITPADIPTIQLETSTTTPSINADIPPIPPPAIEPAATDAATTTP